MPATHELTECVIVSCADGQHAAAGADRISLSALGGDLTLHSQCAFEGGVFLVCVVVWIALLRSGGNRNWF